MVNKRGGHSFGIVNVPGSSIARMSSSGLFTHAGAEIGVASSKAFTAQIAVLLLIALAFGRVRDLDTSRYEAIIDGIAALPEALARSLAQTDAIREVALKYQDYRDFFYLGRGIEFAVALEGSHKLKELSYRHSEAYSSGELKHGAIALIDSEFPSIMVDAGGPLSAKNSSSVEQVRSRSGKVIGVIREASPDRHLYDDVLTFDDTLPYELTPFAEVVILQLFAYHITVALGRDVDKPRNLAKSVTVE